MTMLKDAAEILKKSRSTLIFTGAGISVESGIPPFRGNGGLWESVDPSFVEIDHFLRHPVESWGLLRKIFYDNWGAARPNPAHLALAELQNAGLAGTLVTQNIDCLHQRAGSADVVEFHGTLERLVCLNCGETFPADRELIAMECPVCPQCGRLLKPDVVFFGEGIPEEAGACAFSAAKRADVCVVVGTTGEVMPACMVPHYAHRAGAKIIEINIAPSAFTHDITDIFLQGKAGEILPQLVRETLAE